MPYPIKNPRNIEISGVFRIFSSEWDYIRILGKISKTFQHFFDLRHCKDIAEDYFFVFFTEDEDIASLGNSLLCSLIIIVSSLSK